ncbi:hypothetical protein IAR50_003177 [Cryptococcus sp. DSM 104548]
MPNVSPSTAHDVRLIDDERALDGVGNEREGSQRLKNRKVTIASYSRWSDISNDIQLVSSDHVAVLVPEYLLQAGSTVFRNCSAHRLRKVSNSDFETSSTFLMFLDAVQGVSLSSYFSASPAGERLGVFESLLRFSKKWDSSLALAAYERLLLDEAKKCYWKESFIEAIDIFALAEGGVAGNTGRVHVRTGKLSQALGYAEKGTSAERLQWQVRT